MIIDLGFPSCERMGYVTRETAISFSDILFLSFADPDPPKIEGVETVVDKSHDPPVALLTIKWQVRWI